MPNPYRYTDLWFYWRTLWSGADIARTPQWPSSPVQRGASSASLPPPPGPANTHTSPRQPQMWWTYTATWKEEFSLLSLRHRRQIWRVHQECIHKTQMPYRGIYLFPNMSKYESMQRQEVKVKQRVKVTIFWYRRTRLAIMYTCTGSKFKILLRYLGSFHVIYKLR